MYHAQTFNGQRYAKLRSMDYYFGALILFALFVAMFIPYYFAISKIWASLSIISCNKFEVSDSHIKLLEVPDDTQFSINRLERPILGGNRGQRSLSPIPISM